MQKRIGRRDFLKQMASVGTASWCLGSTAGFTAAKTSRPDILLIMPDQMRGDCLSLVGHPAVRTPCLDELARQGALFQRAYTPVASCIPARFALLSGLYPQTSGVVGYKAKPFFTPTLPELLSQAGYLTVLVGRNMHQVPASKSCGYQKQILGSTYVADDEYDKFLKRSAPETGGIRKLIGDLGVTTNFWQAKPWPLAHELHPTEWVVSQSRKLVAEVDADQPLFLTTSFYAPHPPLFPPPKYFAAYLKQDLPAPAHGDWVDWGALSPKGDRNGHRILLEGETLREAQAGYFGLIEHLDDQISSLVRDFRARSEKAGRPWIVVFTADHGEMLGDHGYFRKCEPFEGSANIPFVICGSPSLGFQSGLRILRPVCLEDIMPTLLSLAGTQIPPYIDGINLVPVLRGHESRIRDWLHFEHAPCYSQEQAFQALTDGRFKYIWRPLDGRELLFDLEKDPREEHDLTKDEHSRPVLETWRSRLVQRLAARPEGFSVNGRLIPGRPYPALNAGTLATKQL
jgi:arylsulfatase